MPASRAARLALVFMIAIAWPAAGQDALSDVKTLRCRFPLLATATWIDGAPKIDTKPSTLSMGFDAIDAAGGTADAVGAFGPVHITVRLTGTTLHFMHVDTGGALYVTTVFAPGRDKLPEGRLRAVHTRHEYTEVSLPGFTSRPEQYYGACTPGS